MRAVDLGRDRDPRGARARGRGARSGRLHDHGPRPAGRAGPDHGAAGGGRRRASRSTCRRSPSTRSARRASSAIAIADQMIRAGELEVVGRRRHGVDDERAVRRCRAPATGRGWATRPMLDSMIHDGLWCAFDDRHMGAGTDAMNAEYGVGARASGRVGRAVARARARPRGTPAGSTEEVVAVEVPQRRGDPVAVRARRGHPRRHHRGRRWPAPRRRSPATGTVTAGNASQISDGAAACRGRERGGRRAARAAADRGDRGLRDVARTGSRRCTRCRRSRSSGR